MRFQHGELAVPTLHTRYNRSVQVFSRVDQGRKGSSFLAIKMEGTNRSGEGREKSLLCDTLDLSDDYFNRRERDRRAKTINGKMKK